MGLTTNYLTAQETPYPTRYGHIVFSSSFYGNKKLPIEKMAVEQMTQINLVEFVDFKVKSSNDYNVTITLLSDEAYVWAKMLG